MDDHELSPLIRDLPEGIKLLALMCQVEQGNKPNENLKLIKDVTQGNFLWDNSTQGFDYWSDIESFYRSQVE